MIGLARLGHRRRARTTVLRRGLPRRQAAVDGLRPQLAVRDLVEEALAMMPRVVVFLEDGFAGNDAVRVNAFTRAREVGVTMKTV